ncbi:MAG: cell division protein FtsQ/DivIB [Mycobacteriales bacterium]
MFDVDDVEVHGAGRFVAVSEVRAAAHVPPGQWSFRVDLDAVHRRIAALPKVRRVAVRRDWPASIVVTVVERTPALVIESGRELVLVDIDGVVLGSTTAVPADVPRVRVPANASPALRAAVVLVVRSLPSGLRRQVATVAASASGAIALRLRTGAPVQWGSSAQSARKAAVLARLLSHPAHGYDVSSPDTPASY